MTSGVLSSNFSSLSPSKTPESKSTWNGRIVKTDDLPPVSHGAGGTTSLVCLCAVTTIIFALGIALTLTGYLTSIIELEIAGEVILATVICSDLFLLFCCNCCGSL